MKETLMEESFKKITESFDLSDYSIMTDTGYKKLTKLHKTVPYEVYELTLKNGMSLKCADNHIVFIQEYDEQSFLKTSLKEVFVKNLRPGSFVCVDDNGQVSESEVVSVITLGYEEEMYDFELSDESDHRYYTNGILSHNTALIETLAIKIANNQVSRILQDKIIYQLDLTSVIAGTKYRGQFEERMKVIIDEIEKDPNIIMFIDEIHTIVGTGNASGSLDVSNILKPALARGTLQCIGATTIDEYKKYIETDHALERRFQKILIKPSTKEQTKEILMRAKDKYEIHHLVDFPEDAIEACVDLADRYITSRFFPDKALDVLDEVGARVHIKNIVVPQYILDVEKELVNITKEKRIVVDAQDFENAALLRDKERDKQKQLEELKKKWKQDSMNNKVLVKEEDVYETVAKMTGIPVNKISKDESDRLINMPTEIQKKIIGQHEAVLKVSEAIQRGRAGVSNTNKPVFSALFLGSTGVGKTELAKTLAEYLFGTKDSLIKLDMSEYMEKHSVSRIIGAPAGYVGYEEGGLLADKVKNNPYCVVLFDEIEKAHPDVLNILLQILDDGKLTDGLGREINFRNTIIIMTSNAGTAELNLKGKVGFKDDASSTNYNEEQIIKNALTKYFRIEFLNRIDEQIIFKKLSEDNIQQIVKIKLEEINEVLKNKKIFLTFTDNLVKFIADNSYDEKYGARPIVRAISKEIQTPLSQKVLRKEIVDGMRVEIDYDLNNKEIKFNFAEQIKEPVISDNPVALKDETKELTKKTKSGRNKNLK